MVSSSQSGGAQPLQLLAQQLSVQVVGGVPALVQVTDTDFARGGGGQKRRPEPDLALRIDGRRSQSIHRLYSVATDALDRKLTVI